MRQHRIWSAVVAGAAALAFSLAFSLASGLAFTLASGLAHAGDNDAGLDGLKTPARSERLDIFGAGMCHQCEWRPHAKVMAAQEQCGVAPDGKARVGVFECGRSPQCDTVCHFISCEGQ